MVNVRRVRVNVQDMAAVVRRLRDLIDELDLPQPQLQVLASVVHEWDVYLSEDLEALLAQVVEPEEASK